MKVAILGGGNCYALNFAALLHANGIPHFGIGRSVRKPDAFWGKHRYDYRAKHLVKQLPAVMAVLDTEKPDVIVNFAAQGEGAASFGELAPWFFETNTVGLVKLVRELESRDYLKRFVQIGTSELYGSVDRPAKESDPLRPSSPYAISKAAFDQYLDVMHRVHGFPANVIRPSNAYCPGQQLHRIIPKAIICALTGQKLPLQGGGNAQKSYLHATDLSKAILSVLERGKVGETYNAGPQSPISIRALVGHVAEACGVSFEELVEEVPDRVGQDGRYQLDCTKIAADCSWTQTIGLARGLDEMVRWVKTYPEILTMKTEPEVRP